MDVKRIEALESKASIKETATSFFVVMRLRSMVRFSEGKFEWDVRKGDASCSSSRTRTEYPIAFYSFGRQVRA